MARHRAGEQGLKVIHEIAISSLGVIAQARLPLGPGLTVVTGETGAGKTMILTGLSLILGGKANPDIVRTGAAEATAEAVLDLAAHPEALEAAREAGAVIDDDGTVTVVRVVGAQRSRAILGGRSVPQALLGTVGADIVTVHGQAEQNRLRSPARQRDLLDGYGTQAHAALLAEYRGAWDAWRSAAQDLDALVASSDSQIALLQARRDELEVLTALAITPGEKARLVAQIEVLTHAESLRAGAAIAHEALAGEHEAAATASLELARRALEEAGRHDETLASLATRLAEYVYGASDIAHDLASYVDRIEADPAQLDAANARLASIAQAERRFGKAADDLEGLRESLEELVGAVENWDQVLADATEREKNARHARDAAAEALSASRRDLATKLGQSVKAELETLAMPDAHFDVEVKSVDAGPSGADEIAMRLSAHQGAPARPVAEAASGGELSRIMLAIEVSLASTGEQGHTFVFDEVDAGVGGRAAQAVGARLAALGAHHQVIVVTHLAQVAAWADAHVTVEKSSDGAVTVSHVRRVDGEDRVREIARLLSGEEDSVSARAHALELLEAASMAR